MSKPGLASLPMTSSIAALDCAQTRILNFGASAGPLSDFDLPLGMPCPGTAAGPEEEEEGFIVGSDASGPGLAANSPGKGCEAFGFLGLGAM